MNLPLMNQKVMILSKPIQAIRGMYDLLPLQTAYWQYVESKLQQVVTQYGYQEIRFPVVEVTELFKRSIGEVTDIVEKEMYTFTDRNDESLTLRPEGTASCVRAALQHGLLHHQIQRLWYQGPMFRYERPQKGRHRQFYQLGAEAFGISSPDIDAELIILSRRFWEVLGLTQHITLQINSLGTPEIRQLYREELVNYFEKRKEELDEDSQRRLYTNPLRILDSKNPKMQSLITEAPRLLNYLDDAAKTHFDAVCRLLENAKVTYEINPRLVRGLDYYTHTVFEWVTDSLGAQGTVCAGGRYDNLVTQLGGNPTPAVGFALGIDRVVELCQSFANIDLPSSVDVYIIVVGEVATHYGMQLSERLRNEIPHLKIVSNCGGGNFKVQFKRADKSGAQLALVIGEDEVAQNTVGIKYLREEKPQQTISGDEIVSFLLQSCQPVLA